MYSTIKQYNRPLVWNYYIKSNRQRMTKDHLVQSLVHEGRIKSCTSKVLYKYMTSKDVTVSRLLLYNRQISYNTVTQIINDIQTTNKRITLLKPTPIRYIMHIYKFPLWPSLLGTTGIRTGNLWQSGVTWRNHCHPAPHFHFQFTTRKSK